MSGFPFRRKTRVVRDSDQSAAVQGFSFDLDDAVIGPSRGVRVNSGHRAPNPWTRSSLPGSRQAPVVFTSSITRPTASQPRQVIEEDPDISLEFAARDLERPSRRAVVWLAAFTTVIGIGLAYYIYEAEELAPRGDQVSELQRG
jgi:hypothetical protein